MYLTAAPRAHSPAELTVALTVTTAVTRSFPQRPSRLNPESTEFLRDMMKAVGGRIVPEVAQLSGTTFTDMIDGLLTDLPDLAPVDFAILAHSVPDFLPSEVAGPFTTQALPGQPQAFAVTDQGLTAPFTALTLAQRLAARHGYGRMLVLIFDQAVLPYETSPVPAHRLDGDAAVALVLERPARAAGGYEIRQQGGVATADVSACLARQLRELPGTDGPYRLLVGPGLADSGPLPVAADVRRVPPGFPCTGLWAAAATELSNADSRPLVVAEHDPVHRDLSVCCFSHAGNAG